MWSGNKNQHHIQILLNDGEIQRTTSSCVQARQRDKLIQGKLNKILNPKNKQGSRCKTKCDVDKYFDKAESIETE